MISFPKLIIRSRVDRSAAGATSTCIMDLHQSLVSKCMLVSQIYNQVPLSDNLDIKFLKNDVGASILRNTGNLHYQNGEYEFALMYYSKGLAMAPLDSAEYSKSFGNRSAALYRLGMYEECLVEIKRALEAGYEENLKPKLMKRMSSCQEILNRQPSVYDSLEANRNKLFVTSPTHHENILCANVPLYICSTESNKREIRAKEDIAPGQLISVEKPYTFDISANFCSLRCHNCFAQSYLLIPCDHCTTAMFCGEKCREESWKSEHKWMCPIGDEIKASVSSTEMVALKTVIKARCDKESWSDFYNSILEAEKTFETTVTRGFVENEYGKMVFDSKDYCSVYGLNVERSSISSQKMMLIASTSAVFIRFLEKYTTFFKDAPEDLVDNAMVTVNKYIFLTGGLLLHNIMICLSNPMQMAGLTPQLDKQYVDIRFGCGIYPFSSLTTHSCTPNTSVVFKDNKAALFAVAPIKRDQKVTVSYG